MADYPDDHEDQVDEIIESMLCDSNYISHVLVDSETASRVASELAILKLIGKGKNFRDQMYRGNEVALMSIFNTLRDALRPLAKRQWLEENPLPFSQDAKDAADDLRNSE